ncbi:MAG: hypothetical protein R3C49_15245 [Planctomycetaceae bacterium]
MDVVLEQVPQVFSAFPANDDCPVLLNTAELLQAKDEQELIAEVNQLQRRRVRMVSVRRQRAMRIGIGLLQHILEDSGLSVCTVAFAGGFTGTLNRSYSQAVDDTRRALELAARLDAQGIIVVPGSRGLHTYGHAERTIRQGLEDCLDDALRYRVNMLLPLNSVLGNNRDIFVPRNASRLDWVESMDSHRIRPMMMMRGCSPWGRLPDCWERCLTSGGVLRISGRTRRTLGRHAIVSEMLNCMENAIVPVG